MNLRETVLAYRYLFLGGLFCFVVHPVCRFKVINESGAKTGSHVFYLKTKIGKTSRCLLRQERHNTVR